MPGKTIDLSGSGLRDTLEESLLFGGDDNNDDNTGKDEGEGNTGKPTNNEDKKPVKGNSSKPALFPKGQKSNSKSKSVNKSASSKTGQKRKTKSEPDINESTEPEENDKKNSNKSLVLSIELVEYINNIVLKCGEYSSFNGFITSLIVKDKERNEKKYEAEKEIKEMMASGNVEHKRLAELIEIINDSNE